MNFIALKMLTGDRAKYLGLIFGIAFCTFLLENQTVQENGGTNLKHQWKDTSAETGK